MAHWAHKSVGGHFLCLNSFLSFKNAFGTHVSKPDQIHSGGANSNLIISVLGALGMFTSKGTFGSEYLGRSILDVMSTSQT